MTWITNSPEFAAKLKKADRAWERAMKAAEGLKLSDKIIAVAKAHNARHAAYDEIRKQLTEA